MMTDILSEILNEQPGSTSNSYDRTMKQKCATNLELFCKYYFPDVFSSAFCEFHLDVFKTLEDAILNRHNEKQYYCRAAPRGHGKSQVISMALPLWVICYNYRKNIVIVSDTGEQAEQFILDIKNNLEDNELLLRDFGNLIIRKQIWRQREIVTDSNIHLVGKSAGQSLRGIKYNSIRPDLVIIDDLENDENVETDGQRLKLYNWFMKVLLKCGGNNPIFCYIGTILNYDALLYKVLNSVQFSIWNRKSYKAVYKFSESPHWQHWEAIMSDLTLGNTAKDKSFDFYVKHKKAMLSGIETLWPEKEEDYYYNLMCERFVDEESFNSELQNDPMTDNMRTFKVEWLDDCMYTELPAITEVYYSVDLSMGKSKKADTSAIIGVGKGIDNYYYVLQADVKRKRNPDVVIEDMVWHIMTYYDKLKGFAVETDVFLEFVAKVMKDRIVSKGFHVNWVPLKQAQRGAKELRVKSLVPSIRHGYIKFHESQRELLKQLRNYPKDADDAVDALEMVMSIAMPSVGTQFSFGGIRSSTIITLDPTKYF
jgi:predicted phage terminase large subunit-like protein